MRSICENCRTKDNCGYLKRGMERDCIDVQTWDDGYEAAVNTACDALRIYLPNHIKFATREYSNADFIKVFEQVMIEKQNQPFIIS